MYFYGYESNMSLCPSIKFSPNIITYSIGAHGLERRFRLIAFVALLPTHSRINIPLKRRRRRRWLVGRLKAQIDAFRDDFIGRVERDVPDLLQVCPQRSRLREQQVPQIVLHCLFYKHQENHIRQVSFLPQRPLRVQGQSPRHQHQPDAPRLPPLQVTLRLRRRTLPLQDLVQLLQESAVPLLRVKNGPKINSSPHQAQTYGQNALNHIKTIRLASTHSQSLASDQ